jgi:hypothetical protein
MVLTVDTVQGVQELRLAEFTKLQVRTSWATISVSSWEGVSRSFRTGRLEWELQMVQLSATKCSCISILWVSLVSFDAITLCVASQRVFVVSVYFVINSVQKLLNTFSYRLTSHSKRPTAIVLLFSKGEGKVVPVLHWLPCHGNACGSEGIAPRFLNLGARLKWVVSFMSRSLYRRRKSPRWAPEPVWIWWQKKESLALPVVQPMALDNILIQHSGSSVSMATRIQNGLPAGFRFRGGGGIFIFATALRPARIQSVPAAPSLGGEAAGAWSWPLTCI